MHQKRPIANAKNSNTERAEYEEGQKETNQKVQTHNHDGSCYYHNSLVLVASIAFSSIGSVERESGSLSYVVDLSNPISLRSCRNR